MDTPETITDRSQEPDAPRDEDLVPVTAAMLDHIRDRNEFVRAAAKKRYGKPTSRKPRRQRAFGQDGDPEAS